MKFFNIRFLEFLSNIAGFSPIFERYFWFVEIYPFLLRRKKFRFSQGPSKRLSLLFFSTLYIQQFKFFGLQKIHPLDLELFDLASHSGNYLKNRN